MNIRERILDGDFVAGTWLQSGSPTIAEAMAESGFEFIVADMEHTDMNEEGFSHFARALGERCHAFARVRSNDTIAIRRLLDCGATGIIVPLVNDATEARNAVSAAKYPPEGVRGFAFTRSNKWGVEFEEYTARANRLITVIVMIETAAAVDNIEQILAVDGVDGVLIGPYDLSGSYGVPGQTEHAMVKTAKGRVLESCKRNKKAAGQHIVLPTKENVSEALEQGYTFLALGMDTVFVSHGATGCKKYMRGYEL